jgi:hypothetical protein
MDAQDTNSIQFWRENQQRRLDLELLATRGRSMWRAPRAGRRRRLFAPLSRA